MASWLFYIAVFLKQFYLLPSGSIGIADLFFTAACVMTFYGAWKKRTKLFYREDIPWAIFLIFAAIINGIYYVRTANREFPLHTMYWIYSVCLIWMFRTLYSEDFMRGLCWVCRINMVFQLLVLFSGHGRYFRESWGGARFMGTFNDPNQFAFFYLYRDAGTFYGVSAESDLYGENTYRLLGNVSVGSVFDRKGKINGDVCRSACILLCAYRTDFLGQMLPFEAEKAVVDRRRGFCGAAGCRGI